MYAFENKYMEEFKKLGVKSWFLDVKDTFFLIDRNKNVDELLNSKHKKIKFTTKNEKKKE